MRSGFGQSGFAGLDTVPARAAATLRHRRDRDGWIHAARLAGRRHLALSAVLLCTACTSYAPLQSHESEVQPGSLRYAVHERDQVRITLLTPGPAIEPGLAAGEAKAASTHPVHQESWPCPCEMTLQRVTGDGVFGSFMYSPREQIREMEIARPDLLKTVAAALTAPLWLPIAAVVVVLRFSGG